MLTVNVYLEMEDGTEYVCITSPANLVICKYIFHSDDKVELLAMTMRFIQEYCNDEHPNEPVEYRFSDECRRVFAGVGQHIYVEKPSNVLTRCAVVGMIVYELVKLIFL